MIPRVDVEINASIPEDARFWVPKPHEIGEEGFGYFCGVWPIVAATTRLTADVIKDEQLAFEYVDSHSSNADEFERLARQVESLDPALDKQEASVTLTDPNSTWEGLAGLDLGVAGLAYALSNAGFYPAASCRNHQDDRSWSPNPIILFAGDRPRVELLQPLMQWTGCGLGTEHERAELLYVYARSIQETITFANKLFANRVPFRKLPKTSRKPSPHGRRIPVPVRAVLTILRRRDPSPDRTTVRSLVSPSL